MGQDDSCGICGNHYQTCRHKIKDHAINPETNKTFCGRDPKKVLSHQIDIVDGDWYIESQDPDNLCKICKKSTHWDKTIDQLFNMEWI